MNKFVLTISFKNVNAKFLGIYEQRNVTSR